MSYLHYLCMFAYSVVFFVLFVLGERAKTGWPGIRIMCPSRATYLSRTVVSVN
jgi:hypothetical protein